MTFVEKASPRVSVLHINGPLRVPLSRDLESSVRALLRRGVRRVELDLAAVSDLDAGGVGELIQVYNVSANAHSALRIVNAPPRVRELLSTAGLFDLLARDDRWWWAQAV